MNDAIAIHTGIVAATAVSVVLAIAPHETVAPAVLEVVELSDPPRTCSVADVTDPDQRRALELACTQYSDDVPSHRFEVFSTATLGNLRGVFVRRSTGDCGGCGALAVAVLFRGGDVELVARLGQYGRFGNGPDSIRLHDVVGHSVIAVDNSISMGGYTDTYREYFVVDRGHLDRQLCLQIAGSDSGARERGSEWTSSNWIANEGTMYFSPSYTRRGEVTPQLYAFSFAFEHGHWVRPDDMGDCLDPRL